MTGDWSGAGVEDKWRAHLSGVSYNGMGWNGNNSSFEPRITRSVKPERNGSMIYE